MIYKVRLIPFSASKSQTELLTKVANIALDFALHNQSKKDIKKLDAKYWYSSECTFCAMDCFVLLQEFLDLNPEIPIIPLPRISKEEWLNRLIAQRLIKFVTFRHKPYSKSLTKLISTGCHDIRAGSVALDIIGECHEYLSKGIE